MYLIYVLKVIGYIPIMKYFPAKSFTEMFSKVMWMKWPQRCDFFSDSLSFWSHQTLLISLLIDNVKSLNFQTVYPSLKLQWLVHFLGRSLCPENICWTEWKRDGAWLNIELGPEKYNSVDLIKAFELKRDSVLILIIR